MKVLHLVYKEGARNEGPENFLPQSSFRFPRHWSLSNQSSGTPKDFVTPEMSPQSQPEIFQEVSNLVMKTWEANKVGHGSDAQGLGQHTIRIRKILCVENSSLYRKYMSKREDLKHVASVNRCPSVKGLQGERQIMTQNLGNSGFQAYDNLIFEMQEYMLVFNLILCFIFSFFYNLIRKLMNI